MNNIEKVSNLRQRIHARKFGVLPIPGIYRWWFCESDAKSILNKIGINCFGKIQKRVIDGETYYALYFGISKDLRSRFIWHISQKHSISNVKNGTLSTLRQTISAVLSKDMTRSETDVNNLMDNCYLEWDYVDKPEEIEKDELSKSDYIYPLNIQNNVGVAKFDKQVLNTLKKLRKQHKK